MIRLNHLKHIKTKDYRRVLFLRTVGNFLLFSSLFMIGKTFYQPVREEARFFIERLVQKKYLVAENETYKISTAYQPANQLAKVLNIKPVEVLAPVDAEYSIIIPKIGAKAKILANIDSARAPIYLEALKKGVAHAAGTAFPGEGGHIYLFAHSTDYFWNVGSYNAIFYLLTKLERSDEIDLFYQGKRYTYKVIDRTIVDPAQVEYLTRKTNKEFLTLQTCWPPGTTLKRLLVFAVRKAE
ncbi:sortase [Candidatus Roizmanbacteria bacterium]|nr:sortase [Candidatus Roizmanbacteria bacterium]